MPTWAWIVIAIAAVAVIALVAVAMWSRQRTSRLRQRFGPEYDRTVERRGGRREAEADLTSRVERRDQLEIRTLPSETRQRYLESWRQVQAEFVDDPPAAVTNADRLVTSVMSDRGYPMDDFEGRTADISVDHPQVVERYRSAHGIARKNEEGQATTEDLRQAMQHYRALFEELLEPAEDEPLQREQAEATKAPSEREEGVTQR
jgi:FtsZ-interacting cell division protein ZipA